MKRGIVDDDNTCNASATDWAALVLSIISINVGWWAFEIPVLFKKGSKLKNFGNYVQAVYWTCIRVCLPSYVFVLVLRDKELAPEQWSKAFYDGRWSVPTGRDHSIGGESRTLSKFSVVKALIFDTIGIIAVGLSVSKLWRVDPNEELTGLNASTWSFPALPVSIFGLWIQIAGFMKLRRRWVLGVGFLLVVLAGATLTIAMHFSHQPGTELPAMALYLPMALPFAFMIPIGRRYILLLTYLAVTFSRVGGMSWGAMDRDPPFHCYSFWSYKLAIPYFVFGALASLLAYLCGPNLLNAFWVKKSLRTGLDNDQEHTVRNPRFYGPQPNSILLSDSTPASYPNARTYPYSSDGALPYSTVRTTPYSNADYVPYSPTRALSQPQSTYAKPQMYARVSQVEEQSPYTPSNFGAVAKVEDQVPYIPSNSGWR